MAGKTAPAVDTLIRVAMHMGATFKEKGLPLPALQEGDGRLSLKTAREPVIAALADVERLDWLDFGQNYFLVTPATNMIGVPKGWTHRVGRSLDSIGERCLDVREAIDKAMAAEKK